MSVKIHYRWSGDGRVPAHEAAIVDNVSPDATDEEIMAEALSNWDERSDYSPPRLVVVNRDEVIASVRAEIARRVAEGGEP